MQPADASQVGSDGHGSGQRGRAATAKWVRNGSWKGPHMVWLRGPAGHR
jgi:hypothetical protein